LNSFWHSQKRNGVDKLLLAWVSDHPLRAISLNMLGRAQQINDQNVRCAMYEVFRLAGFLMDFKDLISPKDQSIWCFYQKVNDFFALAATVHSCMQ